MTYPDDVITAQSPGGRLRSLLAGSAIGDTWTPPVP